MGKDRRFGVNRRFGGNRRVGADYRGYKGPERRSLYDRRNYIERRQDHYKFLASTPF